MQEKDTKNLSCKGRVEEWFLVHHRRHADRSTQVLVINDSDERNSGLIVKVNYFITTCADEP